MPICTCYTTVVSFIQNQFERAAIENLAQLRTHFLFPGNLHGAILHHVKQACVWLLNQALFKRRAQPVQSQHRQIGYAGRPESSSTAPGSLKRHQQEQAELIEQAFAPPTVERKSWKRLVRRVGSRGDAQDNPRRSPA